MTPPPPKPSLLRRLLPVALLLVGGAAGAGVSVGVRLLFPPPAAVAEEEDHAEEHAEEPHEPEVVQDPARTRLEVSVRGGNYSAGLKAARELAHDADHPDLGVLYLHALCLEGLERYAEALEEYAALGGADHPAGVRAVAACGEARCLLALGRDPADALHRADTLDGGRPEVETELHYLRARVAANALRLRSPSPFAPDAPMGDGLTCSPARYPDWLPLPTSATQSPHTGHHAATPNLAVELRAVLAADPPHPDEPAVRVAAANALFRDGRHADAAAEYQAVRESGPPRPVLAACLYNLGLLAHRKADWPTARGRFTDVADLSADTATAALGWWWVGRTDLDRGDADACRLAWERADAAAGGEVRGAVELGKVFLLLLAGESERAAKLFHETKVANSDPQPALAEAFACYFRHADAATDSRREALAAAVKEADGGAGFGPAGRWVLGGWLPADERAAVYEAAADAARGAWAARFALALGEHLLAADKPTAAAHRFAAVTAVDAGPPADRARVRLAEIALADGDGAECVRLGRAVFARRHEDETELLRLIGRGYERMGQPRAAAECFAGRLPQQ